MRCAPEIAQADTHYLQREHLDRTHDVLDFESEQTSYNYVGTNTCFISWQKKGSSRIKSDLLFFVKSHNISKTNTPYSSNSQYVFVYGMKV